MFFDILEVKKDQKVRKQKIYAFGESKLLTFGPTLILALNSDGPFWPNFNHFPICFHKYLHDRVISGR